MASPLLDCAASAVAPEQLIDTLSFFLKLSIDSLQAISYLLNILCTILHTEEYQPPSRTTRDTHVPTCTSRTMAESNKKPTRPITITHILLGIFGFIVFIGLLVLFVLLAADVFTIPILTPIAHFLALIIAPFLPLIFPIYLTVFLRVCAYPNPSKKEWPSKKKWMLITGCWGFSQSQRFVEHSWKIWGKALIGAAHGKFDMEKVCGLEECTSGWFEEALVLLVVIAQIRGWRLDGRVFDKWIANLIREEKMVIARNEDTAEQMEKGVVDVEEVSIVDAEKRALMDRDEVMAAAQVEHQESEELKA